MAGRCSAGVKGFAGLGEVAVRCELLHNTTGLATWAVMVAIAAEVLQRALLSLQALVAP